MTRYFNTDDLTMYTFNNIDEKSGQITEVQVGGTKHDSAKADLALVPLTFIEATARALQYGEKKYGRYNYTSGFKTHRLISAALRHILAWESGEDNDKESGLSHLDHAAANLAMLLHNNSIGTSTDTRRGKNAK